MFPFGFPGCDIGAARSRCRASFGSGGGSGSKPFWLNVVATGLDVVVFIRAVSAMTPIHRALIQADWAWDAEPEATPHSSLFGDVLASPWKVGVHNDVIGGLTMLTTRTNTILCPSAVEVAAKSGLQACHFVHVNVDAFQCHGGLPSRVTLRHVHSVLSTIFCLIGVETCSQTERIVRRGVPLLCCFQCRCSDIEDPILPKRAGTPCALSGEPFGRKLGVRLWAPGSCTMPAAGSSSAAAAAAAIADVASRARVSNQQVLLRWALQNEYPITGASFAEARLQAREVCSAASPRLLFGRKSFLVALCGDSHAVTPRRSCLPGAKLCPTPAMMIFDPSFLIGRRPTLTSPRSR